MAMIRRWPPWLLLTLGCVGFVVLWGLPTIIAPLGTDQMLYSLGARTVLDGGQLYSDFWEIKSPLIFLLYAVPFALVGEHMEAIRVMDMVNTGLAMGAVFLLSRRLFNHRAAVLAAAFYGFTYLTHAPGELAEAESFMAAPLALAFFLYRPADDTRRSVLRAAAAGLLLGVAFSLKATAIFLVIGLPLAELLLRDGQRWSMRGAAARLSAAAAGFLLLQVVLVGYLAIGGALGDFFDIQRNYTAPYNAFRYPPGLSHVRHLMEGTSTYISDARFITTPALVAVFIGLFRLRSGGVYFLALLAAVGVFGIWWQGKLFTYHWLIMIPLLAPLAGYAVDHIIGLSLPLPAWRRLAVWALLAGGFAVLAYTPLARTYDNYRTFASYVSGSLDRREVEQRYNFLLAPNHALVDYVNQYGEPDDQLFIWGLWPVSYFWLDRPLVDRFVSNHGLRATWAPDSWREELIDDLSAAQPRFVAVAKGDRQPWLVGTAETSDEHMRNSFPELRQLLEEEYAIVQDLGLFILYERIPPAPRDQGFALAETFTAAALDLAVGYVPIPGTSDEGVVLTQRGVIWRVSLAAGAPDPPALFADLTDRIVEDIETELGLLGLAFSPDFETDARVFVHYSADAPLRNVLSWFRVVDGAIDISDEHIILEVDQPFDTHNGGQLAFGPDGYLYVALGDGGLGSPENGQDLSTLLGSILRLDVSGDTYTVPPDNPFVGRADARPEIYAYGLRNPWRFSFDRETGELWAADVGHQRWEETNRIVAGRNYGWSILEGHECFDADDCVTDGLTPPRSVYDHNVGAAVIGGFVYRGLAFPELAGWYIFADFVFGKIWALNTEDDSPPVLLLESSAVITSFGELPDGELIVVEYGGGLFRLVRSVAAPGGG